MTNFLGLRGTGDFPANEVMDNWRNAILRLFPNGSAPLTAIISQIKSSKLTDGPTFHWTTKALPTQRAAVTGVYIDSTMGTAYVYVTHQATYGIAGATVYVKMALASLDNFLPGHIILLRDASRSGVDVRGRVLTKKADAANSYLAVKLLEADDNDASAATYNLTSVDTALVIGSAFAEGSERPEALVQDVVACYNHTQIFRTAVDLTRTALQTTLRSGDPLKEARRDALEQHSIEMEKAFIWGVYTAGTDPTTGKPLRTTQGIVDFIKDHAPANVLDYTTDSDYSGKSWAAGGEDWFDASLEQLFRYGSNEKLALCGSGALLGIQRLAKQGSMITLTPQSPAYGLKILEWITPFGSIYLKTHPLFSYETTNRNTILIIEPKNMEYKYIQDTVLHEDTSWKEGGGSGKDALEEDYLTEAGLEFHYPDACGILNGVGNANAV